MAKIIWREPKRKLEGNANSPGAAGEQRCAGSVIRVVPKDKAGEADDLEVKLDGAWYAARFSPREDGTTNVHYNGYSSDEEDETWNTEQIKRLKPLRDHVRVVSEQLQDDKCHLLRVNTVVCALREVETGAVGPEGWYDALITEIRKRHDNYTEAGEPCTCSFTVVWQEGYYEGQERILDCKHICLHSSKDVETHPLIVGLLRHASQDDVVSRDEQRNVKKNDNEFMEQEQEDASPHFKRQKPKSNSARVHDENDSDVEQIRLLQTEMQMPSQQIQNQGLQLYWQKQIQEINDRRRSSCSSGRSKLRRLSK